MMIDVTVGNGKYRYIFNKEGAKALRHGEEWRDCTGDGFILALAQELEEARVERDALAAHIEAQNSVLEKASAMGFFTVSYDSGTDHKQLCRKVAALQEGKPSTSLARRDLLKQAEALDNLAAKYRPYGLHQEYTAFDIASHLEATAITLRQQANQMENQQ